MKDVVIELQNVKKIYKMDGVETHALRGVDLQIRKKEKKNRDFYNSLETR